MTHGFTHYTFKQTLLSVIELLLFSMTHWLILHKVNPCTGVVKKHSLIVCTPTFCQPLLMQHNDSTLHIIDFSKYVILDIDLKLKVHLNTLLLHICHYNADLQQHIMLTLCWLMLFRKMSKTKPLSQPYELNSNLRELQVWWYMF